MCNKLKTFHVVHVQLIYNNAIHITEKHTDKNEKQKPAAKKSDSEFTFQSCVPSMNKDNFVKEKFTSFVTSVFPHINRI